MCQVLLYRISWNDNAYRLTLTKPDRSRSTWACELKLRRSIIMAKAQTVTLHVSVWVEIIAYNMLCVQIMSRSTWACELKFYINYYVDEHEGHAPRERVSWNESAVKDMNYKSLSRSTWACELKYAPAVRFQCRLRSRSTWACELKLFAFFRYAVAFVSRSTWACELKYTSHRRRSLSLTVTLHVSVWVEIRFSRYQGIFQPRHAPRERVSWNDRATRARFFPYSHAPRERVSWNILGVYILWIIFVTLHVSVWVEMFSSAVCGVVSTSRSTWACELK